MTTSGRKDDHLTIALGDDVRSTVTTGLERWRLRHRALPGLDLEEVDLSGRFLGRPLRAPLLVSSMTGGSEKAWEINQRLAIAAERLGIAFALGSIRTAVERPELTRTYAVRPLAPTIPLLANIGAVALDVAGVSKTCELLAVDAVVVHLNALQEAIQPEGQVRFRTALDSIGKLVEQLALPVLVKEVGFGLAPEDVAALLDAGVAGVDVAGAGGTNWALVEGRRDDRAGKVAEAFADWGWPTETTPRHAVALRNRWWPSAIVVASGGLANGVDAAKALCLGADLAGIASSWLGPASTSEDAAVEAIDTVVTQLRIAAFAIGARTAGDLVSTRVEPAVGSAPQEAIALAPDSAGALIGERGPG